MAADSLNDSNLQVFNARDLSSDRLGFSFCLALALHAAFILGVSFNREALSAAAPKLEITLAQHRSQQAPEEADYLAQSDQQGSGTLEEKAMLTSRELGDFQDVHIREIDRQRQSSHSQTQMETLTRLTSIDSQQRIKTPPQQNQQQQLEQQANRELTAEQRRQAIASLEAKLDIQQYAYAKRPRVRRLTSVATKQSDDALYLHNWRTKVELIGNQHYPAKARQQQLYGDLRMVVSLLPNGDVHQVKILESSGHPVLDQAAIKIVHLAAPYPPFPLEMQKQVDILEIIRTWRFHKNRLSSST